MTDLLAVYASERLGNSCVSMTTLTPLVVRYLGERQRRAELAPITVRGYRNHLFSFAESFGNRPLDQLGLRAVERWLEEISHLAPATISLRLSTLRGFAKWCVIHDIVRRDWTLQAPTVRRHRRVARDMTNEHFYATLAQCQDERSTLIVWLMFGCGLRCVEVSRLSVDDFDRSEGTLFVTGKAKHQRIVPCDGPVTAAIDSYMRAENFVSGPLIRRKDQRHGRLGPERISGLAGRLIRAAGVKVCNGDGRSAHGLRAAAASDLYEHCHDPRTVQEFLGHSSMQNLGPYLRRARLAEVQQAHRRRWAA